MKQKIYFLKEIEQNEQMSKKQRKVCTTLNYMEHFLILAFTTIWCNSMFAFASFLSIPIGIMSPAIISNIWAINAGIEK